LPLYVKYDLTYGLNSANSTITSDALGANALSGSSGSYDFQETHYGIEYSQNSVTRWIHPNAGYHSPDILNMYTIATTGGTNWAYGFVESALTPQGAKPFTYSYTIQSSGSGIGIGVSGQVGVVTTTDACSSCNYNLASVSVFADTSCMNFNSGNSVNGGKGAIYISIPTGCGAADTFTWTWASGTFSTQPLTSIQYVSTSAGMHNYQIINMWNGNYDITVESANACDHTFTANLPCPTTTTASPYYFFEVEDCDGNSYVARADYNTNTYTGSKHTPGLIPPSFSGNVATIQSTLTPRAHQMTIMGQTFENCVSSGGGRDEFDPYDPGGME